MHFKLDWSKEKSGVKSVVIMSDILLSGVAVRAGAMATLTAVTASPS